MRDANEVDRRESSPGSEEASIIPEPYCAPEILWEQEFVALATCSFNPCLCNPPPPECRGG